jgi:alpha-galactosidase
VLPFGVVLISSAVMAITSYAQTVTIPVETQNNALVLQTDADKNLENGLLWQQS